MNDRIDQLAVMAKLMAEGDINRQISYNAELKAFAEKFAELIVKECANFVENVFDDDGGHATCEDYAKGVKQYFGVEE